MQLFEKLNQRTLTAIFKGRIHISFYTSQLNFNLDKNLVGQITRQLHVKTVHNTSVHEYNAFLMGQTHMESCHLMMILDPITQALLLITSRLQFFLLLRISLSRSRSSSKNCFRSALASNFLSTRITSLPSSVLIGS